MTGYLPEFRAVRSPGHKIVSTVRTPDAVFSLNSPAVRERIAVGKYDQLRDFIAPRVWDATPVETELLVQADRLVGGSDAVLVIDDIAIPKKGTHSVGVAAPYASALGKTSNCQTLLSLVRGEVPERAVSQGAHGS